jgi:translation initiation factor 2 beta subunit (eIF-2beta)/eIF-5
LNVEKIQMEQEERYYNIIWEIMEFAREDLDLDKKTLVSYLKRHLEEAIKLEYKVPSLSPAAKSQYWKFWESN